MDTPLTSPAAPGPVTVSLYEKQPKIYPRVVRGFFTRWRWVMVWITQAVFYGLPWLAWNGTPVVLFDLEAQRFHVFGLVLYPQDFVYLTAILVIAALATLVVAFGVAIALRAPFRVDVIRDRNTLARVVDDGAIENIYRLQLLNATAAPQRYRIGAAGPAGLAVVPLPLVAVGPAQVAAVVVHLHLGADAAQPLRGQPVPIQFVVADEHGATVSEKSTFYVPR